MPPVHASIEVLGKGWLGTTYLDTLEGGGAALAVKRLRETPDPECEFRDAAVAIAALRHENLAALRANFYSCGRQRRSPVPKPPRRSMAERNEQEKTIKMKIY